jgi:tetratricopeptide (TPR) repeat protein
MKESAMKKSHMNVALLALLGSVLAVANAQAPDVEGVCVANCPHTAGSPPGTAERTSDSGEQSPVWRNYNYGIDLYNSGRFREAEVFFREAIRLDPSESRCYYMLGNTLFALHRYSEAEAPLREAIGGNCHGCKLSEAYLMLGSTLWELGRLDEAAEAYRKSNNKRAKAALGSLEQNRAFKLGLELYEKEDWAGALEAFRRVIRLQPNDVNAHYNISLALWKLSRLDEALVAARQAFALEPSDEKRKWLALTLNFAAMGKEDLKQAEALHREALSLYPTDDGFIDNVKSDLRKEAREASRPEQRIAIAKQILLVGSEPSLYDLIFVGRVCVASGQAQEGLQRFAEVEARCRKKINAADPSDKGELAALHAFIALAREAEGDPQTAFREYQEARRIQPDDSTVNRLLGQFLYRQKDYEAALPYLRQAATENPDHIKYDEVDAAEKGLAEDTAAARELNVANRSAQRARRVTSNSEAAEASRVPFDRSGADSSESSTTVVDAREQKARDPIITPERRTTTITLLETKRDAARVEQVTLEKQLDELKSKSSSPERNVKIAELKQKVSTASSRVEFYIIRIGQELSKLPPATSEKPEAPEKPRQEK